MTDLDAETEDVLDEARALRQQFSYLLVWISLHRNDPARFAEAMRSVGYLLRHTGDDLITHATRLDRAQSR